MKESAARELAHRTREIALEALSGDVGRELLYALVGAGTLPAEMERRILEPAEGNPFFLEELVRSLVDAGALVRGGEGWRFDHEVEVEVPPTVEKVILARIDRLQPDAHDTLMAASVLGRQFGLPLLEAVSGSDGDVSRSLLELQRLDLVRESRRWPEPEYRFKHVLIQEAAYRTLVSEQRDAAPSARPRSGSRRAYAGARTRWRGCSRTTGWRPRTRTRRSCTCRARGIGHARSTRSTRPSSTTASCCRSSDERRNDAIALVLFKLALAFHMSLRFAEANEMYQRAFDFWMPPPRRAPGATLRIATSFLPNDPDPRSAIAWPNIQLCMQLFDRLVEAWPERTLVPSLADRWEIADDGLRYVFHLRGADVVRRDPLTAHDIEFGIKRVLNPDAPGSSVAIYFVLENGQDYYLRRNEDADAIGVRALDDRTVEFRLVAPAPYFMSVMNRPDGGPQPRHAIERDGEGWTGWERRS